MNLSTAANVLPRYSRQMILPSIGIDGQKVLSTSSVLVVGAGGIGSTVLLYLAGAGIGHIGVLDFDIVETTNLHRQIIHDKKAVNKKKCISAVDKMKALNDELRYTAVDCKLSTANALEHFRDYNLIVDATDNFEARYIINDACVLLGKPLVSGSAVGFEGQVTVIAPGLGPCYRCLYPKVSLLEGCRSCANAGVLGPVPGLIGCLQAIEVIKVMLCPDIAVRITAHAAIRKENNLRRIYDDVDVEVVEVEVVEEENISKKRKVDESDETKESNAENKEETLNRNDKTNESANGTENESSSSGGVIKSRNFAPLINRQVLFDATEGEFHNFNLPPLNPSCAVCGPQSTIFNMDDCAKDLDSHLQRVYQGPDLSLQEWNTISSKDYAKVCLRENESHFQIDVRVDAQYNMINFNWYATQHKTNVYNGQIELEEDYDQMKRNEARLARAVESNVRVVHFSLAEMKKMRPNLLKIEILNRIKAVTNKNSSSSSSSTQKKKTSKSNVKAGAKVEVEVEVEVEVDMNKVPPIYCTCRRGVDSILATQLLVELGFNRVYNVEGGLTAWNSTVDKTFPIY